MSTASFSFSEELEPFLIKERRGHVFQHTCARAATLKNAIEALGVPYTEVGAVTVNGEPATLQRARQLKSERRLMSSPPGLPAREVILQQQGACP